MNTKGRFVDPGEAFALLSSAHADAVFALRSMPHPRLTSHEDEDEVSDFIAGRLAFIRTNFSALMVAGENDPEWVAKMSTQYIARLVLDLFGCAEPKTRIKLVYRAHSLSLPCELHEQSHREMVEVHALLDEVQLRGEIARLEAEGWPEGGAS